MTGFNVELIAVWGFSALSVYYVLDRIVYLARPRWPRKPYRDPPQGPQAVVSSRPDSAE